MYMPRSDSRLVPFRPVQPSISLEGGFATTSSKEPTIIIDFGAPIVSDRPLDLFTITCDRPPCFNS
jgi:hypothetical protein